MLLHDSSALPAVGSKAAVGCRVRVCLRMNAACLKVWCKPGVSHMHLQCSQPNMTAGGVIEQSGPRSIEMFLSLWGIFTFLYFM